MEAQEKGGVSIREYLDMQISHVKVELGHIRDKIAHEKELGSAASKALTKALELQAEKYEQRLEALNHEAERLQLMVTREMFEEVVGSLRKEISGNRKEIELLTLWRSRSEGKAAASNFIAIISAAIAAIALILSIYK